MKIVLAEKGSPATLAVFKSEPDWKIVTGLTGAIHSASDGSNMTVSRYFAANGGTILANGPGSAVREQPIPAAGTYEFFKEHVLANPGTHQPNPAG